MPDLETLRQSAEVARAFADRSSSYWAYPAERKVAEVAAVEAEAAYFAELIKRQGYA